MELTHGAAITTLGALAAVLLVSGQEGGKSGADGEVTLSKGSVSSRAGSEIADRCSAEYGVDCRPSGMKCNDDITKDVDVCECRANYTKYDSLTWGVTRCRPDKTVLFAVSECEIDEDCSAYGAPKEVAAYCKVEPDKTVGKCDCAATYSYNSTDEMCKPYDCRDDLGAECIVLYGTYADCIKTPAPPKCGCKNTYTLLPDPVTNKKQCTKLAEVRCNPPTSTVCPGPLICNTMTKACECPKNTALTTDASGQNICKAIGINEAGCTNEKECPENAQCRKKPTASGPTDKGICLCKEYYKLNPSVKKCQLALGTCCRTNGDCGETIGAANPPLACIRSADNPSRGTCLCQGLGSKGWLGDKCVGCS